MREIVFILERRTVPYVGLPDFCLRFPRQRSAHLCARDATSLPYTEHTRTTPQVSHAYKQGSFSGSTCVTGAVHTEGIQGVQEA